MKISLLFETFLIIQAVSLDLRNGLREERAAPPTEPPLKPVQQILKRHMALARVFNALYLQMELADKKIDEMDVIAGVFNFKDRSSLDKLVSLKVDGLAEEMRTLGQTVPKLTPGRVVDVDAIDKKYQILLGIDEKMRNEMIEAKKPERFPEVFNPLLLSSISSLSENVAEKCFDIIEKIENATKYPSLLLEELDTVDRSFGEILSRAPWQLKAAMKESERSLDYLTAGAKVATRVNGESKEFENLLNLLSNAHTESAKLSPLNGMKMNQSEKILKLIDSVLRSQQSITSRIPIGAAFLSDRNLTRVFQDLEDDWLRTILSGKGDFKKLTMMMDDFSAFSDKFKTIQPLGNILFDPNHVDKVRSATDLVAVMKSYSTSPKLVQLHQLRQCLTWKVNKAPDSLKEIETLNFTIFFEGVAAMNKAFEQRTDLEQEYESKKPDIKKARSNFSEWRTGQNFNDTKEFFGEMKVFFDSIQQSPEFFATVKSVSELPPKAKEIQDWISNIKLANPECEPIFNMTFESLSSLNEVSMAVANMKTAESSNGLVKWVDTLPKFQAILKPFVAPSRSAAQTPKTPPKTPAKSSPKSTSNTTAAQAPRPKRSEQEDVQKGVQRKLELNRTSLLKVAFAAASLELLSKINGLGDSFNKVFQKIPEASYMGKDPKEKEAWENATEFTEDLQDFQNASSVSLSSLKSAPERNLTDIGKVYKKLKIFQFARQDQLRKMRKSSKLLNQPQPLLEAALKELEGPLSMDWGLVYTNFRRLPIVLPDLQKDFLRFFAVQKEDSVEKDEDDKGDMTILICGGASGLLALLLLVLYFVFIFDLDMMRDPPKEPNYTEVPMTEFDYSYMQLQDARLKINKRDQNGNTPMYQALLAENWPKLEAFVREGAVVDACCSGTLCRTILFELVRLKKNDLCQIVLEAGANMRIWDASGDNPDTWADHFRVGEVFQAEYDKRKEDPTRRIMPEAPRFWKVLVYDKGCFKFYKKKRLPKRIKRHITWGYKPGMDLNQFSHIVLPAKYMHNDNTMILDEKDLTTFRLYGSWATLVGVKWLKALANKKIHEEAMDSDYKYFVKNTWFRGSVHEGTVLRQKTSIHKLQPPILQNILIHLLPSKNDAAKNDQKKEIIALIEQFGGTHVKEPVLELEMRKQMPYYAIEEETENVAMQNHSWILKYADSQIEPKWKDDTYLVTLSDYMLLFECIARWEILWFNNDVVKPELERKKEEEMGKVGKSRLKVLKSGVTGGSQFSRLKDGKRSKPKKL